MTENTINPSEFMLAEPKVLPGLHNHSLKEMCQPPNLFSDGLHHFTKKMPKQSSVGDQKQSGRCWLFAALGMLRSKMMERDKLQTNFELSQSYLFFWDKFEKVNYIIELLTEHRDLEVNSPLMRFLLDNPVPDGGYWEWFVNLVNKYGLVPKSAYSESFHSENTREMNFVLDNLARKYCKNIREGGFDRRQALQETYDLLVSFLGAPPTKFNLEYVTTDDKIVTYSDLTPLKFYKDIVKIDVNKYHVLGNNPRDEFGKMYGIEHLNNMVGGARLKFLNITMKRMRELVKVSIEKNNSVWFACDMSQFYSKNLATLDMAACNMEKYLGVSFGLSKYERLQFGNSNVANHAMLITGYHLSPNGDDTYIDRWQVENSWGNSGVGKGYLSMSDSWMKEHVYWVVIHESHLSEQEKENLRKPTKFDYAPWDPAATIKISN